MYLGTTTVAEKRHADRWHPVFGTRPVVVAVVQATKHVYRCDRCGQTWHFPEPATEPFYCSSDSCRRVRGLVSVELAESEVMS